MKTSMGEKMTRCECEESQACNWLAIVVDFKVGVGCVQTHSMRVLVITGLFDAKNRGVRYLFMLICGWLLQKKTSAVLLRGVYFHVKTSTHLWEERLS